MDLVLVQELLGKAEARCIWNHLGNRLARLHFGASLGTRHDGWALVLRCILISHDAHKQPIAKSKRILKQGLMTDVAEIIHTIAVNVATYRHQGHV